MENDTTTEMVHMLESMVSSLNELLAVQEKVVSEQSAKLNEILEVQRKSEALLNEVGEMAHVGGWGLDVRTKAVHLTKETYRIGDISEDEQFDLSKAVLFFDLPGRSRLEAALQRCMETGEPFDLELPFTSARGRHLWTRAIGRAVSVGGEVVKLEGAFQDITEQKRADIRARKRMKELQAFYGLAGLTERKGITLDQLYQEFINLLPDSWQYNEIAYSRIVIGDSEFRTNNFRESAWKQSAPVRVQGSVVGKIEVGYLEERPELDEGPFLKDERMLIDALAERLGRIIERVRTEKMLHTFSLAVDESSDAIGMSTPEGKHYYQNTAFNDLFGNVGEDPPARLYINEQVGREVFDTIMAGNPWSGEVKMRGRAGRVLDILLRAYPVKDKAEKVIVLIGVHTDITERKRVDQVLSESEERYRSLAESITDNIFIIDRDDTIRFVNTHAAETLHLPADEIIGKPRKKFFPPDVADHQGMILQKAFETGEPSRNEERIVFGNQEFWQDNVLVPLKDETGNVTSVIGVSRDITERKQVEEKLKFSNALLSTEHEVSIDGILVVDESGKIISFNRRFIEICGIPPDVVASRSDERVLQSVIDKLANPEEFLARVNYLYANRDEKSRGEISLKDGRVLDRYSAPMTGSDGKYYGRMWTFRDITEQKLVEEVLRESEERYRILAEASPDMIFMVGRDDTIKFANTAVLKLFRLPYDKVVGTPRKNLFPPDIAEAQGILLKKVFETGELVKTEEKFRFGTQELWIDTSSVPLKDAAGHVTAVLGIAHDITERKRIEERLRENEIRYRSLFDGAGEGILVADIDTKKFLHANPAMLRMLGYSEEELITLGLGDIHPKESLDYVLSEFMAQARGEKLMAENLPVLRKDKSIFYANVSSTRILIDEKMCNVGFFSDSTERKKAEEILKRFNEELEQQIKSRTEDLAISLKEKETLLKEIHHRVRNNLQVVSSIISLQVKSVSDPGSLQQIREIRMRIGTLALVHEIAYLAKTPDSINMRDFLYRCTSKVIDEFGCEPGRINITITAENIQVPLSQAVPCSLIVNELLMNSIRHAFPGKRHGEIKIGFSITKGNYVLEYGDDGVGLPEGIHPDKAETGGLALIQGLARQIRGTVGSTTRPGTGCTLTFPAEIKGT